HPAGSRRRSIRTRLIPSTATYGTSTTAASASPATGATTAATVSRHTAATHTAGTPDRTTTRRWKPTHPATTAASPSSAARLNTFDPMITPAPTLAWPRASATTEEVISGASAASAATSPSHASENPARSPSRSSPPTGPGTAPGHGPRPADPPRHGPSGHPGSPRRCGLAGSRGRPAGLHRGEDQLVGRVDHHRMTVLDPDRTLEPHPCAAHDARDVRAAVEQ